MPTEPLIDPTETTPFACPHCGASSWKADYFVATWQDCTVIVDDQGEPQIEDYSGVYGTYDDGETENEMIVCRECGHEHRFGNFRFTPIPAEKSFVDESVLPERVEPDE